MERETAPATGYVHVPLWKRMLESEMFRMHCGTCGGVLTVPLCEITAPSPAAFCSSQPPGWAEKGWIKMLPPPYGTFWRSLSEWPSTDGMNNILGVDFGIDGQVLMFSTDVLAGVGRAHVVGISGRRGRICAATGVGNGC